MDRKILCALFFTVILCNPAWPQSSATDPDDCDSSGAPPGVGGNLDAPDTSLVWGSDAADLGNGVVCFDRFVRNKNRNRKLIFDWPPGSMAAPNGVPPGKEMRYNARLLSRETILGGPLFYGPTGGSPLDTQVYRETTGKTQARALTTHVTFWVLDENGESTLVDILFTSSVVKSAEKYVFRYSARNKTLSPAHFFWTSAKYAAFDDRLALLKATNNEYRFSPVKDAIRIPPSSSIVVTVDANRQPELRVAPMVFYSKTGKPIALAPGLALAPIKQTSHR